MTKKQKRKRKPDLQTLLSKRERNIAKLETKLPKVPDANKDFAKNLLRQFKVYGKLTDKQWFWVKELIPKPIANEKPYFLYAISAANKVKLGYSKNIYNRKSNMQVSNADKLSLKMAIELSCNESDAKIAEKKLHRYCKEYHIRGEWYDIDCLPLVKRFKIEKKVAAIGPSLPQTLI